MFKRKKKLINKKFQLRSVYIIISITAFSVICVVILMMLLTVDNRKIMNGVVDGLNKSIEVENAIVGSFVEYKESGSGASLVIKADVIKKDHENAVNEIRDYVIRLKSIVERNYYIIFIILALFILQSVIFCIYLIRFTHRIAGPVHVITGYMENILNGDKAHFRELRDRDELKDFHAKFIEMVAYLEERRNEKAE